MNDEQTYTYYAFVSYSHKDEKWAKWIQAALERYRLPAVVRKEVGKPLPPKICPVFLDDTDLGPGRLLDKIRQELEQSRFLIVVCSPNSAKPNAEGKHWVNEEATRFCELGRADRVIPVIVDGTAETAFCPTIRAEGLLGLDATKHSKARVLNDLVAKILGLRPDELWRREERRLRAKHRWRILRASLAASLVALGGYIAWDSTRTVTRAFADYVDSYGLPEGIFPLNKADLEHRYIHYRFEFQGFQHGDSPHADSADWCFLNLFGFRRRLVRVVQANSHGYPRKSEHTEYCDRPEIQDFLYDRNLRLREIQWGQFNGKGNKPRLKRRIELFTENGNLNGLAKFFLGESQIGVDYNHSMLSIEDEDTLSPHHAEVSMNLLQRDSKGRMKKRIFLNLVGTNIADSDGTYGVLYENDEMGRVVSKHHLFRDGDHLFVRADKHGVSGIKYTYDGCRMAKTEYVDGDGNPTMGYQGWMETETSFDSFGNIVMELYKGANGELLTTRDGYAMSNAEYDGMGNIIKITYADKSGHPILSRHGYCELRREHDASGRVVEESYWGIEGHPTLIRKGFSCVKHTYNDRGNVTRSAYYGADGEKAVIEGGYSVVEMDYDKNGNMVTVSFSDQSGNPTMTKDCFSSIRYGFNKDNRIVKIAFLGVDGKPIMTKRGSAEVQFSYDFRGNIKKEIDLGPEGNLVKNRFGFAVRESMYDGQGNEIERVHMDEAGGLTMLNDGIAGWKSRYDDFGEEVERSFFDSAKKPCLHVNGFAGWRHAYDDYGNITNETCYGISGESVKHFGGFSELRIECDGFGRPTCRAYYDEHGRPILNKEGYSAIRIEYDQRGYISKRTYFDVEGNRKANQYGISEIRQDNDSHGNMTYLQYFDAFGRPTCNIQGFSMMRCEYDALDNVIVERFYDENQQPTLSTFGVGCLRFHYDALGNRIRESNFDCDGKPVNCADGFFEVLSNYDSRGNLIRRRWLNSEGNPTYNKDGIAELTFDYDSHDIIVNSRRFDIQGQEIYSHVVGASGEVFIGSVAEKMGIKSGDIWCRFGDYDLREQAPIVSLFNEISSLRNKKKQLVIARRNDNIYIIIPFELPEGPIGVRVEDKNIADYDKLLETYSMFCEQENGEGK